MVSLIRYLETHYREVRETQPFEPDTGYVRVSSLGKLCPREEVLVSRAELVRRKTFDSSTVLAFDTGHEYHYALQNKVLAGRCLYGHWRCTQCAYLVAGPTQYPRPSRCPGCDARAEHLLYVEQHLHDHELRLAGHPDGFLLLPGRSDFGVLEAKSTSKDRLKDVQRAPYPEHVVQLQAYLLLTGYQWGLIFYWSKGTWGLPAFVEHFVSADPVAQKRIVETVRSITHGVRSGVLPERVCDTPTCDAAKHCVVSASCWSTDERSGSD